MAGVRSNKGEVNTDGYYYQLYTMLHSIDCLRKKKNVREYDIGNAVEGFGALDDVVFNVTLKSGNRITNAVQVKHSNTKNMIDERYLCQHSRTCLYKYVESFVQIKKTISLEQIGQLILWTNMPFAENIHHWIEKYVPDYEERDILGEGSAEGLNYERYRIKNDLRKEIIQKCMDQARKENAKGTSQTKSKKATYEPLEEEWNQFFDRFVFYVKVPSVSHLKSHLVRNVEYFDDFCELVESCAVQQIVTSAQIDSLLTLVSLRNSMEAGPYTKMKFSDLDKLQCLVEELFENEASNCLRVKASQDVDCTVARLIAVIKNYLAAESNRYLVFSYDTFIKKRSEFKLMVENPDVIEKGLKCIIMKSITDEETNKIKSHFSTLKVIYVGSQLENCFDDKFHISCIDDASKEIIKTRQIELSQWQCASASKIFGENLFRMENYSFNLGLYRLDNNSMLKITVNEPSVDIYYLRRTVKLTSPERKCTSENEKPGKRLKLENPVKVDLLNQTDFRKLVINDQPGMGKTTEMVKLCSDLRAKYQDHLVVYITCREAVIKWDGSVQKLICRAVCSCSVLTTKVIVKIIQLGKLCLIMDGYDEVSQEYNEKLKSMVSEISRVKMFRLYITTRPQCKKEIIEILGECGICDLAPFSTDDQMAYLKKFWGTDDINDEEIKVVDTNARCIIDRFRSTVDKPGNSIIGIPLQTHMIAVIYKERILSSNFEVSDSHLLGFMYQNFIELKFMESVKRNYDPTNATHEKVIEDLRNSFLQYHIDVSILIYENGSQSKIEDLCDKIQHYGFITTRPSIAFVHYSYLEYFMTLYILIYPIEVSRMEKYIRRLFFRSDQPVVCFMNYLLNYIDLTMKANPSLNERLNCCKPPAEYKPLKTTCLHNDKMIEFKLVLQRFDVAELSLLFSIMYSQETFNVFEVFYDSITEKIKSKIKINDSFSYEYYKKTLTSESFINYLVDRTPKKTFATLFLIPPDNIVPFLLKLMCNRGFSKLFVWFTEMAPLFDESQVAAIEEIIGENISGCFDQIRKSHNTKFLQTAITWVKKNWTINKTKQFLVRHGRLNRLYFGCNEEHVAQTIELVHIGFELYRWVYGEQILFEEEILSEIELIQRTPIIDAFVANLLPLLKFSLQKNTGNKLFFQNLKALDNPKTSILELICASGCSKHFDELRRIIEGLNQEKQAAITKLIEQRLYTCLLKIIESENVELLNSIIFWLKKRCSVDKIRQNLIDQNIFCVFAKNIENFWRYSSLSKRNKMFEIVFELYSWAFGQQIPRCIRNSFGSDNHSTNEYLTKNYLEDNATFFLSCLTFRKTICLELMCYPNYSKLFEWFTEFFPNFNKEQLVTLKNSLDKQLEECLSTIIKFKNIELLQNIIDWVKCKWTKDVTGQFLIDKNILYFIAKNTYLWEDDKSKTAIVHIGFDLYRWAFGEQIPLIRRDVYDAVRITRPRSIRDAFVMNIISIYENLTKQNPEENVAFFVSSLTFPDCIFFELVCNPDYSKLFEWFTEIVPNLNQEQRVTIKDIFDKQLTNCLLTIIEFDNVKLLQNIIIWVKNKWTKKITCQFLIDKNLLCVLAKNIELFFWESDETKNIEIVDNVFDLYRWAFDEQVHLERDVYNAVRDIGPAHIKNAFVVNIQSTYENLTKKNREANIALFISSLALPETIFFELLCDPSYLELFYWLQEIVPNFNQEQHVTLKIISDKQFDSCLLKTTNHDNVKLLHCIIFWVKSKWTKEEISQFLIDKNLLCVLAKNIEHCINDSDEVKRIEIVESIFHLYHWVFEGQIPLDKDFLDAVRTIKTITIRQTFEKSFGILNNRQSITPTRNWKHHCQIA